jgi:aspartyl protease family protein
MAKDPWQVPDHKTEVHKPSAAWRRAAEAPPKPLPVVQPKLLRLLVFLVGMALLLYGLSIAFPLVGGVDPYLVRSLLIAVIFGGAAAYWSRASLLKVAKAAGLWVMMISGISFFYLYHSDFSERFMTALDPMAVTSSKDGLIVQRARDGHFWLRAHINGVPLLMMVDTGASNVVLSPDDAKRVGFDTKQLSFNQVAQTANGDVKFARVNVGQFGIGEATFYDVEVTVNGTPMAGSLLGMAVLNRFASVEFRGDSLILRE